MSTLNGKVALVTGASRGIGATIAKRLAKEGAAVAITYSSSPEKAEEVVQEIKAAGGKAIAIKADATNADAARNSVAETVKQFGRVDILVNNAGVLATGLIDDFAEADFDRSVAVNIKALFVTTQEAVKHMGRGGRVINIGSVNSNLIPFAGGAVYAMTKSAVDGLTRGLARDLGPRGITVNNVQPGPVDTDMNPENGPIAPLVMPLLAVERYGKQEEIASFVAYLAGPETGYITGAGLRIDGGFAA